MLHYIDDGETLRLDSMCIPKVPGNRHYEEALAAVEAGEAEILPAPGPTLDEVAAGKRASIQAEKCRVRDGGFLVDGVLFDSDQSARTSYLELVLRVQVDPAFSTRWKASAGIWVEMNAALFTQVQAAGTAHMQAAFAWQEARDAEVAAILAGGGTGAEKIAALEAVDVAYQMPG